MSHEMTEVVDTKQQSKNDSNNNKKRMSSPILEPWQFGLYVNLRLVSLSI